MITINGVNKWTPAIYNNESPVNWTAERNRSENYRNANQSKQNQNKAVIVEGK